MTEAGHNSAGQLKAFVERIERLEEEKRERAEDIREVYTEAKANGYDAKALRKIVALRKQDEEKAKAEQEILSLYASRLGMDWLA